MVKTPEPPKGYKWVETDPDKYNGCESCECRDKNKLFGCGLAELGLPCFCLTKYHNGKSVHLEKE